MAKKTIKTIILENGGIYTGENKNEKPHGKGSYYVEDTEEKYKGDWVNGKMHGKRK